VAVAMAVAVRAAGANWRERALGPGVEFGGWKFVAYIPRLWLRFAGGYLGLFVRWSFPTAKISVLKV